MTQKSQQNSDVFGLCLKAYQEGNKKAKITVRTDIAETDYLPADYLFRGFDEMPEHEKVALLEAKGKVLDIGACAGSHSLFLQSKNFDVTALDISEGCCEVMKKRGVEKVVCADIFNFTNEKFDTIFLLMNGIGMAGTLPELPKLFNHLKTLLNEGGQIIFDSSDLQYLYFEDDGSINIPLGDKYYGELVYNIEFQKQQSGKFNWFFADPYSVEEYAAQCGLKMEFIQEGEHYDYSARLFVSEN